MGGSVAGRLWRAGRKRLGGKAAEGGALVEFAVVLPLMMGLILGMFTLGISLNNYLVLTSAVGMGARTLALSRGGANAADPCSAAVTAVYGASPMLTQSSINFTIALTTGTNTTTYSGNSAKSCAGATLTAGAKAQVTATYPTQLNFFGYAPQTLSMVATTTELVQ